MPMIVNTAWLLEYLEPACTHEELLEALPAAGLEIESLHALQRDLAAVRIGFVREKSALSSAPGMYLCQIELERGRVIPVVCASEHEVQVGWGVPVAPEGLTLPTGKQVKGGSFHGADSRGMICLDGELGMLARGSGMHYFTDESTLGTPLPELISIPEYLAELNVLPNRPDFLGAIGIAREVAALLNLQLRFPPTHSNSSQTTAATVPVEIQDPELCSRYLGGLVRGVKVGPSPSWLKARLLVAGMRPINNIVDITNYVLYEYGQPLHAFDYRTLRGGRIVVRKMQPGESLELLTGATLTAAGQKNRNFSRPPLVIADGERPVALAGIMGGAATQTTSSTEDIFIESACFDPVMIRGTVKEVDLAMDGRGTASSYRFERGTDPNTMVAGALARALQLVTEIAGGEVAGAVTDVYPQRREPRVFKLSAERTSAYLGMPVEAETIRTLLGRQQMQVDAALTLHVPTCRGHVDDAVVLIEDVARLIGYGKIPVSCTTAAPTLGGRGRMDRLRQAVAGQLVTAGFYETRNPSLESPAMSRWLGEPSAVVTITNAQSAEMSVARRSLLPGLARTVDGNIRRGVERVRFFEIDRVFDPQGQATADNATQSDRWRVAGMAGGLAQVSQWQGEKEFDFFTLKGLVEDLLEGLRGPRVVFQPHDAAPFLSGTGAQLVWGDRILGVLGQVAADQVGIDRLNFKLFAFELDLHLLDECYGDGATYRHLSRQPAVTRDLAVVVPTSLAYADLEATVRQEAGAELESLRLVDVYQGTPVPAGQHSLALRLVLRDATKSLSSDEASTIMTRIIEALKTKHGAVLRA
ncbi:MAG: phenylalanine--tRNA ligase subunit beta [Planctomycetota bacterium]